MFGHLEDPAPPPADGAQLRSVLRRASRLRAQRRGTFVAGIAVACFAAALAAGGLSAFGGSPGGMAAQETAYQFNESAHLHEGGSVPATTLSDVVFIDANDGFGLAAHRSSLVLAATSDGGANWRVVNGHLPDSSSNADPSDQLEFVSATNGYLWAGVSSQSVDAPLWVTRDGGRSFTEAPIGPLVYDVSAIGHNAWALASTCASTVGAYCATTIEISSDGGASWTPGPAAAPYDVGSSPPGNIELARVTLARAYVLTVSAAGMTLAYTPDAASSWFVRTVPCTSHFDLGAEVALSSTDDLWLICGGQATAGSQAKALYRSADGGLTWTLGAQSAPFAGTPALMPGVGSLPLAGYVAPYSIGHKNLNVLSSSLAWLFPTRGEVIETSNGGASWAPVPSLSADSFGSGAPGNLTFITASSGWVAELGVGLWHTTDGTYWQPLGA